MRAFEPEENSCYDIYARSTVHQSALKHGLSASRVHAAWVSGGQLECQLDDAEPQRLLRIGFDSTTGMPVDLIALVFGQQRVLIIHAMAARQHMIDLVERGRGR
ncbi:MAG: toxin [Tessaracoccus sp.]|uniref:hypothetical protein n=1 Tax=Tessaracoccus sp. TaxID=1971211 RepID=UPI001EC445BA|nr:hypothetical protein [Tessaracoccus sp.]MBK7822225.1 toxin [Tessaracoccus sp.]